MVQEGRHIPCGLCVGVVYDAVKGVNAHAGKKGDGYGFARQIEGACLVAVEVALLAELRYIPEHGAALHMVAIQEVEAVGEIPFVLAVQEDGAGEGELALHILVDILHIILPLYHRVVDMGIVHGDPGADVGIEFQQLFKGEALRVVRGGLILEKVTGVEGAFVEHGSVPEGVTAVAEEEEDHEDSDEAEHFVRSPCQFCREFQTVFSSLLRVGLSPPPSGEGQREERRVGLLPHRPHRAELASELWDPVGWCVGRVNLKDVLHTLPFYFRNSHGGVV